MGVHWEIWLLRGGVHEKPIYRQEFTKRASWTVCKFKGGLVKKGVGVFEGGGVIPQCTLWRSLLRNSTLTTSDFTVL